MPKQPIAMPDDMPNDGKRLWNLIVQANDDKLTPADAPAMEMACRYYAEANFQLRASACLTHPDDLKERHACVRAAKVASSEFAAYCTRFGLTPRDRASLEKLIELPTPESDLSEFGM